MKVHKKSEIPAQAKGEPFSVDVITYDKMGMINIGFYNYDSHTWGFNSDTLCDYMENKEFVWIYPPLGKMHKALTGKKNKTKGKQSSFSKLGRVYRLWKAGIEKFKNRGKHGR